MTDKLGARASHQALAVPATPATSVADGPSGFDPSRLVLEHYSDEPLHMVISRPQQGDEHWRWRGKPLGLWVSVKGENDWPSWCDAENFGKDRLGICHRIHLHENANILCISNAAEIDAFDAQYGHAERLSPTSSFTKWLIDWEAVARVYDGIVIAPYIWGRRLDTRVSDWYYGWDCASGVIWNADAINAIAMEARQRRDAEERPDPKDDSAGRLRHRPDTPSLQTPQGGDS